MRKQIVILILLASAFVWIGLSSNSAAHSKQFAILTSKQDLAVDVENVIFDKKSVFMWCPGPIPGYCTKNEARVIVTTFAKNTEKSNLTYYYIVSGGKIKGQGASIVWDFAGARRGKHTITVGIGEDYVIQGKTITKTIDLEKCPDCFIPPPPCYCPEFSILGPVKLAKQGDSIIFRVDIKGEPEKLIIYEWSTSNGTIINGQGTSQIMVATSADTANFITVAAQVGDKRCNCEQKSEEVVVTTNKKS